jgi:predicted RNA-binding Zn-ribbon protein involved in translation (DUF1610 family)
MSGLSRKPARLEVLVQGRQPAAPTFWTPARVAEWSRWACAILEAMPPDRGQSAYAELITPPADERGPLTRHVATMAAHAVMGAWDAYVSQGRPVALPEAVCAGLEAHPDADPHSAWDCEDCGFETLTLRRPGPGYGRQLLTVCPLCGGEVRWQDFNCRRWGELWRQQRTEMAAR